MLRLFFCVIIVNCSGSRSICSSSSDLLDVSTKFSVSYHWKCKNLFILSFVVQAITVLSLGILDVKCDS